MSIKMDDDKIYLFECWECSELVPLITRTPILRVFCDDCKEVYESNKEEIKNKYIALKIEVMYERALRILEKQSAYLAEYKEAAEAVIDLARRDPNKFQSSHEMVAAMELIKREIPIKMQHKVKRHRIDVLIPSMKVALEIDGYLHKHQILKDSVRDIDLINGFGKGWEVIRIPTKHIEQNVKQLVPAIIAVYKEKQKLRKQNGGFIPKNYSKRDEELQKVIAKS